LLGDELDAIERQARIYSSGALTLYPFQGNLHGLPPDVVYECLLGFVQTLVEREEEAPANFEQYILHHFGRGIAARFMVPYNHKLWGVHPRELTSAWCERFVPIPSPEQVLAGAVGAGSAQLGYNVSFSYPRTGGIEALPRALAAELDPARTRLGCAPERIDPRAGTLTLAGETVGYSALISSIPLPELVGLLSAAPDEVLAATGRLRSTAVRYLSVATRRPAAADYHWVYVPEEDLPFYRVGIFSNVMPAMAPAGCSSLYVELDARRPSIGVPEALQALVSIGAIASLDDVLFAELEVIDPGYVVFDEHYAPSLETIHSYLRGQRIVSCGRYGEWIYNSMEDSLLAGRAAAELTAALDAARASGGER